MAQPVTASAATVLTTIGTFGVFALGLLAVVWRVITNELRTELRPNGGSSFRDAMDRRFDRLEGRMSSLEDAKRSDHTDLERKHRENQAAIHELSDRVHHLEEK